MNFIYRLLLTFNATSLILVIYFVKERCVLGNCYQSMKNYPDWISYLIFSLVPIIFTLLSILLAKWLSKDDIPQGTIKEIEQANNAFLPSYLGYFFVALSVPYNDTLVFVFIILFVFTLLSQTLYFNPLFLLFGYHFYYLTTTNDVKLFVITRKAIKTPNNLGFENLKRINNFTFIDKK